MLKEDQGKKQEAILLYQRAIELGSSSANYNLGLLYKHNKNYSKAKEMFEIAIKNDNSSSAMMSLGDLYRHGNDVEKNMELAEKWYRASMQSGNYFAITRLGMLYGELEKYDEAIELYTRAYQLGYTDIQLRIDFLNKHFIDNNQN